jgi:hypothetical protein
VATQDRLKELCSEHEKLEAEMRKQDALEKGGGGTAAYLAPVAVGLLAWWFQVI